MPGNNLTIQIGGDSSKLRADLKLTQAQLKALDQQIGAAVKSGDLARARQLSDTFGKMKDEAVKLDRGLKGLGATGARAFNEVAASANRASASMTSAGRVARRLTSQFTSLRGLGGIVGGGLGSGLAGGVIGVGVGAGISRLVDQFGDLAKSMREIRDLSREAATKPILTQAMQELGKEAGESAETANKFLTGLSGTLAQVATKTRDLRTGLEVGADATKQSTQNFATFGDKVVEVVHGAEPRIRDFSNALAILKVKEQELIKLPVDQQMQVIAEAFLRTQKNAKALQLTELQLNEVSKSLFGVTTEPALKLAKALVDRKAKEDELAKSQRGATQEHLDNLDEVAKAQEKLSQQTSETTAAIANAARPAYAEALRQTTDFIKAAETALSNLPEIWRKTFTVPGGIGDPAFQPFEPVKQEANTLPPFFETLGTAIGSIWKNTFSPSGMGDPSIPAMPVETTKTQFGTLPAYFQGLADQIKGIWADLMKTLAAQNAAAAEAAKSLGDAAKRIKIEPLSGEAVPVGGGGGGSGVQVFRGGSGGGGDFGVNVLRGTGRGPDDGHGPVVGGEGSGYGPQRATQSTSPGFSDYQAQPFRVVSPMATSTYGSQAAKSAAEASADAAAASRTAAEASRSAAEAWNDPSNYASGGMVRGPGSGTSDSILARVSNGEFVMRAAAVTRVGAGFLSRLNGFADGGMVMPSRSIPSFASGGLVEASAGGTPVHLHLGNRSFALSGNNTVVDSLVSEAHRHKMRAAGTKPSWYGGSPGR